MAEPGLIAQQLTFERVPTAPYDPCYFVLLVGKVVAVVYFDDDPNVEEGVPPEPWFFFLASATRHHTCLGATAEEAERAVLETASREIAEELCRSRRWPPVGLEDLPASRLPWRLI